jgi:hypothetical protein
MTGAFEMNEHVMQIRRENMSVNVDPRGAFNPQSCILSARIGASISVACHVGACRNLRCIAGRVAGPFAISQLPYCLMTSQPRRRNASWSR